MLLFSTSTVLLYSPVSFSFILSNLTSNLSSIWHNINLKIYMLVLLCTHLSLDIIRWKLTLNFLSFHLEKSTWKFSGLFCHYLTACLQFPYDTSDENKSYLFCHFSKLSNVPQGSCRLAVFFFMKTRGKNVKKKRKEKKIKPIWHSYFFKKHHMNNEFRINFFGFEENI